MSRFVNKLKHIDLKIIKDPNQPMGGVLVKLQKDDIDELEKPGPEEEEEAVRDDVLDQSGKLAIISAGVELAYKGGALAYLANEDVNDAGEKMKAKLGVSGSDDSWKDVKESLQETSIRMQKEEYILEDYLQGGGGGGGGGGSAKGGSNGNADSGDESD